MVVGDPAAAHTSRVTLQERLQSEQSTPPPSRAVVYDIYTQARAIEATESVSFASAYEQAFRETVNRLDDRAAYQLETWFIAPIEPLRENLQRTLDRRARPKSVTLDEAIALLQAWFEFDAYRNFGGLAGPLLAEDIQKRYIIEEIAIPVANGATVTAALVRPRLTNADALPTLLEFTLDRSSRDAREAAAHGYASVLALSRIAGDPTVRPRAPFESDGDDARAAIDWVAKQAWSDGRVGMQGVGYGGFVAWSAAKRRPAALKAIATADPLAPGIDLPNPNGIFQNSAYRWVYDVLAPLGDEMANDDARWRDLDEDWYRAGRRYREFPTLPGRASAIFRSWLNHPSYDRFWQKWLPFGDEFKQVDIPVLTVTGYYSAGATGALYYFTQHQQHGANVDHALLIGPFDSQSVEHGAASSLRELRLDVVARIDPSAARYAWLEHALRGAERPPLVSANVNYQLGGANEWRHESSLTALESAPLRLYLEPSPTGAPHKLAETKPAASMPVTEARDLKDRTDAGWRPMPDLVLGEPPEHEGTLFVTSAFDEPLDLAGRLRGELDFTINKYDVDLVVTLYELRSDGVYVKLFDPAFSFRASYAKDRIQRRLLIAGVRQQLPFQSERMVGRRLAAGSRLAMTIGINRRADSQVNYGAGNDVSEESLEDAGAPVRIRLHEGSFIEIAASPIAADAATTAKR